MWDETYLLSELPSAAETLEEVDFIWNTLQLAAGDVVLDLCCGQGRHALHLAQRGCYVIGLDASRFLLKTAQDEIKHQQLRTLNLIEGDMRSLPFQGAFDTVINLYTSFGFFPDAENRVALAEIASVLKPGGKLLLDYWNPYTAAQLDGTRNWWWITEELLALAEVQYDAATNVLYDHRTVIDLKDSSIQKSTNQIRFYFPTELEERLHTVGLDVLALYGDFDGRAYDLDARRLIVVAQKPLQRKYEG